MKLIKHIKWTVSATILSSSVLWQPISASENEKPSMDNYPDTFVSSLIPYLDTRSAQALRCTAVRYKDEVNRYVDQISNKTKDWGVDILTHKERELAVATGALTPLVYGANEMSPYTFLEGAIKLINTASDTKSVSHKYFFPVETLEKLKSVKQIQLYGFPECLGQLINLQCLWLGNSNLRTIPLCTERLTNLFELDLSHNELTSLPEGLSKLNLISLKLHFNKFKVFPPCIPAFKNLKILRIENNELEVLPETIGNLTNLHTFCIDTNKLKSIPQTIGQLENLSEELNLARNQLESLPETIGNCTQLKRLVLVGNPNLRFLPQSITKLQRLELFYLNWDTVIDVPESLHRFKKAH